MRVPGRGCVVGLAPTTKWQVLLEKSGLYSPGKEKGASAELVTVCDCALRIWPPFGPGPARHKEIVDCWRPMLWEGKLVVCFWAWNWLILTWLSVSQ